VRRGYRDQAIYDRGRDNRRQVSRRRSVGEELNGDTGKEG
jgi:hypothetical protein